VKEKPGCAKAHEGLKHLRKRRTKVDLADAVLGLEVGLDLAAFGFLRDGQRVEGGRDMLVDLEPNASPARSGPQPASRA